MVYCDFGKISDEIVFQNAFASFINIRRREFWIVENIPGSISSNLNTYAICMDWLGWDEI